MDMLSYLTTLIKTHKEVGIPGLGTIYKKKSPGRYDAETHSFLPPSYVLSFSSEQTEDQLLVAHICKTRNISPDAAGYYVNQFAEGIHKQLEEHQKADFHPLGTLSNDSGTLVFTPSDDQNFGFDFYGLPVLKDEVTTTPVEETAPNAVEEEPQQTIEEVVPDAPSEISNDAEIPVVPQESVEELPAETEGSAEALESIIEENEVEEENPGDGATAHPDTTLIPPVINLEKEEVPIIPGEDPSTAIAEQDDLYATKAATPEPVVNTSAPEPEPEPVRPTLNEIYAQSAHKAAAEPAPVREQTSIQEEQPVFYNSNAENSDKGKTPVYLKILIVLLLILIGLAAAYFIRPDLFDSILKKESNPAAVPLDPISGQDKQTTDTLAYTDSLKAVPANDTAKKDTAAGSKESGKTTAAKPAAVTPPAAQPATAEQKPATTTPVQTGTTFEVIGSSVSGQKEVDHFIAQMKRAGITAKAIPPAPGKKKIKISIATFKDEAAARAELPKLEEKLGIKGLYVHTNKPL